MKNKLWNSKISLFLLSLILVCSFVTTSVAFAAAPISSQMGVGSSGMNVTNLQNFLASNPAIYPEGLVTGYFGQLTKRAVENFQVAYDLPNVGRVGPLTMATLNQVMAAGRGIDISAPQMSGTVVNRLATRSATVSWNTNEAASAKVFYDTRPLATYEANHSFAAPIISSTYASASVNFSNSQTVTLSDLTPGVMYYYIAQSTDASGNVSVSTQGSFAAI
ncbi:MAG: peptidoglycan-binding protein [Candidatus Pacebacteria bacterium]|nr:peptidoglycan-binding protein [Candidatus Paceibacterota bacterium]